MENGESQSEGASRASKRRRVLVGFVIPFLIAAILFSSMFAFALKYHWMDESIDTGPVAEGTLNLMLSPDGGSFQMTYTAQGGGLVYATNSSGHWVKAQLTTWPVSKASVFLDSKKAVHVVAVNESNGDLLYINNVKGAWNTSVVDTGADARAGCAVSVNSIGIQYFAYSKGGTLMYGEGKIRNWTLVDVFPLIKPVPVSAGAANLTSCSIVITEKGVNTYPSIAYSLDNGQVGLANRTKTKWYGTTLESGEFASAHASIVKDVNGLMHILYLAKGSTGAAMVGHSQNTGANDTFVKEAVYTFPRSAANVETAVGMDYSKRLHVLCSSDGMVEYVVGSWNGTYRVHDLSPKVTHAGVPFVTDLSGRVYAVVEGSPTSLVTDNLTVFDQMRLNGSFTIAMAAGTAVMLGLIVLNYRVGRKNKA